MLTFNFQTSQKSCNKKTVLSIFTDDVKIATDLKSLHTLKHNKITSHNKIGGNYVPSRPFPGTVMSRRNLTQVRRNLTQVRRNLTQVRRKSVRGPKAYSIDRPVYWPCSCRVQCRPAVIRSNGELVTKMNTFRTVLHPKCRSCDSLTFINSKNT